MKTLSRLALALAFALVAAVGTADVQKKTLLASDGTLYVAQTGLASELGLTDLGPNEYAVIWSSLAQDGTTAGGEIPRAANSNPKTSLDLTFDEPTGTLVVLWREESSILNSIELAFSRSGNWTLASLLPNIGFPHAYNPQMLLTHETVHSLDKDGADVFTNRVRALGDLVGGGVGRAGALRLGFPRRDDRPVADRGLRTCPTSSTPRGPRRSRGFRAARMRSRRFSRPARAGRSWRASRRSRPDSSTSSGSTIRPTSGSRPSTTRPGCAGGSPSSAS